MEKLKQRIRELLAERTRVVVAIDGCCASGKTTLADALAKDFDCNVFHMDDYFLRPEQRTPQRLEEAGGNVDYERFYEEILVPTLAGKPLHFRPFDCGAWTLGEPVTAEPKPLTIVEGSYSHHPYFGNAYDLRVFLRVEPEIWRQRILERPAFLHSRFFEIWHPMETRYFEEFSIPEKADFVLDTMT